MKCWENFFSQTFLKCNRSSENSLTQTAAESLQKKFSHREAMKKILDVKLINSTVYLMRLCEVNYGCSLWCSRCEVNEVVQWETHEHHDKNRILKIAQNSEVKTSWHQ